jgi:hypothetical protein
MSESIKTYLVDVFAINPSRISTKGQSKPNIPSEQPGGTLALLREETVEYLSKVILHLY